MLAVVLVMMLQGVLHSTGFAFASQAICPQENKAQPERLHLTRPFPESGAGHVELTASSPERDLSSMESSSMLQLRGNVEVRMATCGPTGHDDAVVCDKGAMVLQADAGDYNEKTGQINASGDVHLAPFRAISKPVGSK
jgi:hypothetical protein